MLKANRSRTAELQARVYEILEQGPVGSRASRDFDRLLILLIVLNLICTALESVPELGRRYALAFNLVEFVSLVVFTLEYAGRLWIARLHPPFRHLSPRMARWRYATSAAGIVDLLSILPFWFAFVLPVDLRFILVFRFVRFLKLTRYSPAMRSLLDALYRERRALFGCVVILIGATMFAATLMYLAERHVQPDKLGTIPDAMWWAIVTLGTIGYGDVVPVTAVGKVIAGVTIFLGLIMVALPVGIIASAFADEVHRRDFVVTWAMVARVPLFSGLDASEIADIMRLLRAQQVEPGGLIVRRGDPAHSMYFIAAGEVEIELPDKRVRLDVGHFFGEIAVLRYARRSANVTAISRASLLVLDAHDFHILMERDARLAQRVKEVVRARLGRELITPRGDLVTEEIDEAEAEEDEAKPQPPS
jgi:voltage-gated potassium channel